MNKNFTNENLIISPLSAYQVLSLTANGAKGKTLKEMISALENKDLEELNKINSDILKLTKEFKTVEIANAVMTKFLPKQNFLIASSKYGATVETLKSVDQVNGWCEIKTHGKIKKILDSLSPNTLMILLNAVYFKGKWEEEFDKKDTRLKTFYNCNDKSKEKQVERMSIQKKFLYYSDKELQMVELPYQKDSMSAIIILPNRNKNINELISEMSDDKIQHLIKKMNGKNEIALALPKFELEFKSDLNDVLKELGIHDAFDDFSADFREMKEEKDIYIKKVIQKTYLKVDEEGTEAAAVTVIKGKPKPCLQRIPIIHPMIVDRPFLFLLKNDKLPKNNEMLFMYKIEKL
jgi:serpin B